MFESKRLGLREWATDVTRDEFDHLRARVDIVEREVEGEQTVTRHVLEQTRRNGDDLAAVKSRLDRHDQRFDSLERRFDGLQREVHGLRADLQGLRNELPTIVGDVMRDVLRERDKKR
jgi:chromosome segregation ATPase